MIFITIIIIFLVIHSLSNSISYSNDDLLRISNSMNDIKKPLDFPNYYIGSKEEFEDFWQRVTDDIYKFDRRRNIYEVNIWCYCVVKYYTKYVLQYGNFVQKSALRNYVKLLERNKLI